MFILRAELNESIYGLLLTNLSATRWSANYSSVDAVYRSQSEIINALDKLIQNVVSVFTVLSGFNSLCSCFLKTDKELYGDKENRPSRDEKLTRDQAINLRNRLISFEFNVLLRVMRDILRVTNALTCHLQKISLDVLTASNIILNTNKLLQSMRNDDETLCALIKVRASTESNHIHIHFADVVG